MSTQLAAGYGITIRKETIEGEEYYVGRAAEFPDAAVYEDTAATAYESMINAIEGFRAVYSKHGKAFPAPLQTTNQQVSGRVTLRMPKDLHATLERQAGQQETSLNQHMVYLLANASARLDARNEMAVQKPKVIFPKEANKRYEMVVAFDLSAKEAKSYPPLQVVNISNPVRVRPGAAVAEVADDDEYSDFGASQFAGIAYAVHQ